MTVYQILSVTNKYSLMSYLELLPNFVNARSVFDTIRAEFNHNQGQTNQFLRDLAKKTTGFVVVDGTKEINLSNFAEKLQTDQLLFSSTPRLQLTNLPTTYTDVFPSLYDGFPIPVHFTGYSKAGFVLLWNKNGSTGNHDLRLIRCDNLGNPLPNGTTPDVFIEGLNIPSGRTTTFDFNVPEPFEDYRGFLKIQARSSDNTNDPIFDGLFVYLVR